MEQRKEIQGWKLCDLHSGKTVAASVPGDITYDLYRAGVIPNPHYGENHKQLRWIAERDFVYTASFSVDDAMLSQDEVYMVFDGVDLFADITLNGTVLGYTENAFLQYRYEVKRLLKREDNIIEVKLHSTVKKMQKIDAEGYISIFNRQRMFIRKPQCHFGWDWAPNMPAYGLCGGVYLEACSRHRIEDVTYRARTDGTITFIVELSYDVRTLVDEMGIPEKEGQTPSDGEFLVFALETAPGSGVYTEKTLKVTSCKDFMNFSVEDPQLWWPNGYGAQPFYNYRVTLYRGGEPVSQKQGRCALREVILEQKPVGDNQMTFAFRVNGKKIFANGSNWVPLDCFTGVITEEKYRRMVELARDCNMNMLRVWGGGLYEPDCFYDACDEMGILIFQDFMWACSDLPENDPQWQENAIRECEYQVKRLRNHPCIAYWSGMNEKVGALVRQMQKGDFFLDYILPGLVSRLDPTRPFGAQSPIGLSGALNDGNSGDTHAASLDRAFVERTEEGRSTIHRYREFTAGKKVSFLSECAVQGPNSLETLKKAYLSEKLWPISDQWVDRMTCNPYDGIGGIPFVEKLNLFVTDLYGKAESVEEFVAKGMQFQAEILRVELERARANTPDCAGFMNWMYSEIWANGAWALVDYYTEPKQAYYQLRRSFRPVLGTFIQNEQGDTDFVLVNNSGESATVKAEYGLRTYAGESLETVIREITLEHDSTFCEKVQFPVDRADTYLYVRCDDGKEQWSSVYSPDLWSRAPHMGTCTVSTQRITDNKVRLTVTADGFVKGLFIHFPDNYRYSYSDNYLDLEHGQQQVVEITCSDPIDLTQMVVTVFGKEEKI